MKSVGATASVTSKTDLMNGWVAHHGEVFSAAIVYLLKHKLSSLMNWLVIGIALALPAVLYVMLSNISGIAGDWGGKPRVSLYLQSEVSHDIGRRIAAKISSKGAVETVRFISSEVALKEFQEWSGFGPVLNSLDKNPLPHVIEVTLKSADPVVQKGLITGWENSGSIARVAVDLAWLERAYALLLFGERFVWSLALALSLGVILIMGNTVRLTIENRRNEIEVMKLFGGSDSFVRRPFLYLGFWYGFGGAIFALVLLESSLLIFSGPVEILAHSYQVEFALEGPGLGGHMVLLVAGSLLGIIGALLAVSRHLNAIEP